MLHQEPRLIMKGSVISSPETLSPLPQILHHGLAAVSAFGLLSFLAASGLLFGLIYRLFSHWNNQKSTRINQFLLLLMNLLLADLHQALAFSLNINWLRLNSIVSGTAACHAQAWLVSTGDVASGVFTLAIAAHAFADIVYGKHPRFRTLAATIAALWIFVYGITAVGLLMHHRRGDFYTRAGAWCWINAAYPTERLWLHYAWVIVAEFGTVLLYAVLLFVLQRRVRRDWYKNSTFGLIKEQRARAAAKCVILYPAVYVVCTLPLVVARLASMAGRHQAGFAELCVAGAMITSNGWMDVLLYVATRKGALFGEDGDIGEDAGVLETFRVRPDQSFGTTTTIEAVGPGSTRARASGTGRGILRGKDSRERLFDSGDVALSHERYPHAVKTETVVQVVTEEVELDQMSIYGHHHHGSDTALSKDTNSISYKSDR